MRFILSVAVFIRRIRTMFAVCSFIVLCCRGNVVVISFGVYRGTVISSTVVTVSAEAGFAAAPLTLALGLLLGGAILRCLFAVGFFGCIHHVYVM